MNVTTDDPWDLLDTDLRRVLADRVEKMFPGKSPSDHSREMDAKGRADWVWQERHRGEVTESWKADEDRITADADAATVGAFQELPPVVRPAQITSPRFANTPAIAGDHLNAQRFLPGWPNATGCNPAFCSAPGPARSQPTEADQSSVGPLMGGSGHTGV